MLNQHYAPANLIIQTLLKSRNVNTPDTYIHCQPVCQQGVACGAGAHPSVQWVRGRLHPGVAVSPSEITEKKTNKQTKNKHTFTPPSSPRISHVC